MKNWIAGHYGSRRGCILTWRHQLRYIMGDYRVYRQIDWESVERMVFVCKGNICRSAYAEAVARTSGIESVSCGIDTVDGAAADQQAMRTAALKGIDLGEHRTTPLQSLKLEPGDLLIAMEPWQTDYLEKKLGKAYERTLLGLWGNTVRPHIQDPFGTSPVYFKNCFDYIEKAVHEIVKKVS